VRLFVLLIGEHNAIQLCRIPSCMGSAWNLFWYGHHSLEKEIRVGAQIFGNRTLWQDFFFTYFCRKTQ